MPARCSQHVDRGHRADGRCARCQNAAQRRYTRAGIEARRKLAAIEAALAVA